MFTDRIFLKIDRRLLLKNLQEMAFFTPKPIFLDQFSRTSYRNKGPFVENLAENKKPDSQVSKAFVIASYLIFDFKHSQFLWFFINSNNFFELFDHCQWKNFYHILGSSRATGLHEVHHVDWPIIHSKLPAVPGISKFVHGIKVVAANVHNNYFAPNLGKSKTFMLSSNLFSDCWIQ